MAELFADIISFKTYVGGAVNASLEMGSIAPTIVDTARRHLVPYLGYDFYLALVSAASGSPTAEQTALLPYARRALALLSMHEYSKIGSVQFGESGMFRTENDNRKSAYRYQEKQYQGYMLEKGYEALEEMLRFLTTHQGDYSIWVNADESLMHRQPLLNYAGDFRRLLYVQCDRYTFECLRPIIHQVEQMTIATILPAAYYTALQGRHATYTTTQAEKRLIDKMRSAIGQRAYSEALLQHIVQVKDGRVYVVEEFGEQSNVNKTIPNQVLLGLSRTEMLSDIHTKAWKDYAIVNVDLYPTLFDVASGGTSTDDDAWHIDDEDEIAAAERERACAIKGAVYRF